MLGAANGGSEPGVAYRWKGNLEFAINSGVFVQPVVPSARDELWS
jgi:hypothetical protein